MNRDEYTAQRAELMAQVAAASEAGDPTLMASIMTQVEALDDEFREALRAAANNEANQAEHNPINMKNMSQPVAGGKVTDTMENNMNTKPVYTAASQEYHDGFLKNLQHKSLTDIETEAFQAVAVNAPGTIPTTTLNRIMGKMQEAPLLAAINMMNIPGSVSIPVEGTVNDANWVAMGTAATDSADTVTTVNLSAYKLIKTVEITADLEAMAIDAFETWLVDRLARKLRIAADKAVCVGTGSGQPTGLLNGSEITKAVQYTNKGMTYKDMLGIIAALPSQYRPSATFVMPSKLFFEEVLGMVDTAGRPVVIADAQAPAKYNILGYPVILDDFVTLDNIVFGDLVEGYTFNWAKAPTVDRDESVGFRAGTVCFRGMGLADGKVVVKSALVKATRAGA